MISVNRSLHVVAFCCVLAASPAVAQERLLVLTNSSLTELDTSDASLGSELRTSAPFPIGTRAVSIAGGRYLFTYWRQWSDLTTVAAIFDTRTFTGHLVPPWTFSGEVVFERDDFEPRVFYRTVNAVGVIEGPDFIPRVLRATADVHARAFESPWFLEYAHATRTLFLSRGSLFGPYDVVALDADTGAVRGTIPLDGRADALKADSASRTLIVPVDHAFQHAYEGPPTTSIQTFSLDTLSAVASSPRYQLPSSAAGLDYWVLDPARRQILGMRRSSFGSPYGTPWAFSVDTNTLTPKASVGFAPSSIERPVTIALELLPSTVRNRIFSIFGQGQQSGIFTQARGLWLFTLDANTLQTVANVDLAPSNVGVAAQAILLTAPLPPQELTQQVTGRRVDLTWTNPGDTTDFVIEVGTIPGRSNIGIFHVGNVTSFSSDVPPGTYYVRVRALNDVGASLPSNEVVINVR